MSDLQTRQRPAWRPPFYLLAMTLSVLLSVSAAIALPPVPANDTVASAQVIGPNVPIYVEGTTIQANNDISTTGLGGLAEDVDGPDVFYSFTPAVTDTYRIHLHPWLRAPLRSSDRQFTIYIADISMNIFAGARAPSSARPVSFDAALTGGQTYIIGVDYNATTRDNFPFTLIVDILAATNPDTCASVMDLPAVLPSVVLNDIDGASADYTFTQGTGRCAVSGTTPTTAPGIDHVYHYVPPADGDYAVELVSSGFDGVIYVMDSCPGVFPFSCLGASNHSTGGTSGGKHEFVVVTLQAGKDYYIFVDNGSTTANSGPYALIVDDAYNYEVNEIEPNDSIIDATPITTPLTGGQLVGPVDVDYWAVTGQAGDRVYCWVNNGGSANSYLDTDLAFLDPAGSLIEFDDEDGDGINSPINDLYYIYSTTAPTIAGAQMTTNGTHYLEVTDQSDTGTVDRYRFHVGVEPATRSPLAECEPNGTFASADYSGKHYYSGVIDTVEDLDVFKFEATIGDRVFIGFDGDPERDSTGFDSANTDPNAFHGKLVVYDPDGDVLLSDVSDSNTVQSPPDYPAQAAFFTARHTGTYYVEVGPQSSASQVGPTETYNLAIFLNNAAPALTEEADPVITQTPDYANDIINVDAADNQAGDSGICNVQLFNNDNLQLANLSYTSGDGLVSFDIELVDTNSNGTAKLLVTDCAGNTACEIVTIDVSAPVCDGLNVSSRNLDSLHDPIHVPDNTLAGTNGIIEVADAGLVTNVTVTVTVNTLDPGDIDMYLVSPSGTPVELVTDRMSSLGIDVIDATFDDTADEIMSFLSSDAPWTGTWLPEDPAGLAKLDGEQAQGEWKLNVVDDSSSADFGATLVRWTLNVDATFAGPQRFAGTATDEEGIQSIVLSGASNVQLDLPGSFAPGDKVVDYTVSLIDSTMSGSGMITVTDLQNNTCTSAINLNGLVDTTGPANTGGVTTDLTFKKEVQEIVPEYDFNGVVSTINVPDSFQVGEVEVALMVDSENQGRIAAKLTHNGEFASLVNRIGMDERAGAGNTKNSFDIDLDDDAPQADDIHMEPALGSIATLGRRQPDGRGEYFGDGIDTDDRDNMLFKLANDDSSGAWDLLVADTRELSSSDNIFRRWALTLKNPCGPERYVGQAIERSPESGVCSIDLQAGATNLAVVASFTPGDEVVDYRVELVDPMVPGNGTLDITDCAGNVTSVPIALNPIADPNPPMVTGALNMATTEFEGTATDNQAGDSGIASVELAPYAYNLELVSVTPDPPGGAGSVDFVVGLANIGTNGRGYVRVEDSCGQRAYILVDIDAVPPVCTGVVANKVRYFSGDVSLELPDANVAGITTDIVVADTDVITDVDLTFNITHPFDDDIDMTLISPTLIALFSDIGSTANDFIDTTLDDEAAAPIPDSFSAGPFTGSFQPEGGPALFALDGAPASGTYTLQVVDDAANYHGTFDSWSLLIESDTFPPSYDGRAEDSLLNDMGICSVELLPGSDNVTLTVDPAFMPGDAIVRYLVELIDLNLDGSGTVRVTDCAGNYCDSPIELDVACLAADLDGDLDIDVDDYYMFLDTYGTCLGDPKYLPGADFDDDDCITAVDYQYWLLCYRDFVGNPTALPPQVGDKPSVRPVTPIDGPAIQPSQPQSPLSGDNRVK